jgi:hypothetical protein
MKKTNMIIKHLFTWLLFFICTATVCEAGVTVVGTLDRSSLVWERIKDTDSTVSPSPTCDAVSFDSYNNGVPYEAIEIRTPLDENLSASAYTDECDSLLALYCDPFDPENPQDNLIAIDDDGFGYPHPQLTNIPLEANTSYILVVTSYSTYRDCGNFAIYLDGSVFNVGGETDPDNDGFPNGTDNCPDTPNPNQVNDDSDAFGNACDNCPDDPNDDQIDADSDGIGDECDDCIDVDDDEACDDADNCLNLANPGQEDSDGDDTGDACDVCSLDPDDDIDSDGICGDVDNCPDDPNSGQENSDNDDTGDACDVCSLDPDDDTDNDGVCGDVDNCPEDSNPSQTDTDFDGKGDVCDPCPDDINDDIDNDSVCDHEDNCPDTPNPNQVNDDGDALGNDCDNCPDDADNDVDADGVCGDEDNCPDIANSGQDDFDDDGEGDICDDDIDGDGVPEDGTDLCDFTPVGEIVDATGCAVEQLVPCEGPLTTPDPWKNHGKYMAEIGKILKGFLKEGLITKDEKASLQEELSLSDCGK